MRGRILMLGAGLAIIVVSQLNAFDIWLSDYAYDFELAAWAIDHSSSIWRPILYDGPKALIIVFGLFLIVAIVRVTWLSGLRLSRREAVFLLLCLAIVPTIVGLTREHSGVSCPRDLQHYGGQVDDDFGHVSPLVIFRGAHFVSHIVITMLIAVLIIQGLRLAVLK